MGDARQNDRTIDDGRSIVQGWRELDPTTRDALLETVKKLKTECSETRMAVGSILLFLLKNYPDKRKDLVSFFSKKEAKYVEGILEREKILLECDLTSLLSFDF